MLIKVAHNAGFCMGVKRAVDLALATSRIMPSRRVFTYGQLIHNPQTVELLKKRGVIQIDSIAALPTSAKNAVLIVRAHGISPHERAQIKAHGVKLIDATCPRVGRVQAIVRKHSRLGYDIVIIGDIAHPEVNAILGYAEGRGFVVGSVADIKALPVQLKICAVAQTTCSTVDYANIVAELRTAYPDILVFNTICDSTEQRQEEVCEMARTVDTIIVVGGKNSANTRRLARIAAAQGTPSYHIESEKELPDITLPKNSCIGVAAGASTPNWVLDRVVDGLRERARTRSGTRALLARWASLLVRTDIFTISGAIVLGLVSAKLQSLALSLPGLGIATLFIFALHIMGRLLSPFVNSSLGMLKEETYAGHEKAFLSAGVASLLCSLFLSYRLEMTAFPALLTLAIAGVLYNTLQRVPAFSNWLELAKIPAVALTWALTLTWLPVGNLFMLTPAAAWCGAQIFFLVLARSLLSDTSETQNDALAGKATLPIILGKRKTIALTGIICLTMVLLAALYSFNEPARLALAAPFFYLWICSTRYVSRPRGFSKVALEALLGVSYIVTGLYLVVSYAG